MMPARARGEEEEPFWALSPEEALAAVGSRAAGLSSAEAAARLRQYGENRLAHARRDSDLALLLRQLGNPLVLLLVGAAVISLAVHETHDAAIILMIVFASALLGFWQERGAARAVERLLALVAVRASVVRDGAPHEVAVEEVVPGDVVALSAGSLVPGDCRLLEAKSLFVDEAALTGETYPAEKRPEAVPGDTPLARRTSALFLGTHVVSGTARAVVVRTGRRTEFGRVSERLAARPPETDFELGLQRFGYLLVRVTGALVFGVFAVNILFHRPVFETFLFALALAVGLTPELLPAIVSLNLSRGARRMAQAKVIVKRLDAIESFGSMDVLCSDKTGTLTEGKVRLCSALAMDGSESARVLALAAVNAGFESGFANPIDQALREAAPAALAGWRKIDEVPYDFLRKRLSVLAERAADGSRWLITKGALAQVLAVCARAETAGGETVPLEEVRDAIQRRFEELSDSGLRTLGLAIRRLEGEAPAAATLDAEADMTFSGFVSFYDPPKPGVEHTLAELRAAGIAFKVITGDNRQVALRLARLVGIENPVAVTGPELRRMSDAALPLRAAEADVFAEVEPNQKERIILALRKAGHGVGFLGDGINDASALHAADVGISVDSAVDVAKEAADLVLLERDLGVLVEGVREGRRTFANTLKYIFITTSANFGNVVSMAGASLFLPFLPLLPTQILLNNFLSDFPAMALGADRVDPELVEKPQRWDIGYIRRFMVVFGAISSAFDFLTFWVLLSVLRASPERFRSAWFLESVLTELLILLVIRTRRPLFRSRPGRAVTVATAAVVALSFAALYVPWGRYFDLVPLPPVYLAALTAITLGYVAASEAAKHWFFRRFAAGGRDSARPAG
jgi:Mg2+-importing ATPase